MQVEGTGVTAAVPKGKMRSLLEWLLLVLLVYTVVQGWVVRPFVISGISMLPTLKTGQVLLVDRLSLLFGPLRTGQIVIFHPPIPSSQEFVKRVIATAGQTVSAQGGVVSVNGRPLSERYLRYRGTENFPAVKVPPGRVFVMGDNRPVSEDSRFFGVVPVSSVTGVAFLRVWPLNRMGGV